MNQPAILDETQDFAADAEVLIESSSDDDHARALKAARDAARLAVESAVFKATRGKTKSTLGLSGEELRRVQRVLNRRARRANGLYPIGSILPAAYRRVRSVSK